MRKRVISAIILAAVIGICGCGSTDAANQMQEESANTVNVEETDVKAGEGAADATGETERTDDAQTIYVAYFEASNGWFWSMELGFYKWNHISGARLRH